MSTLFAGNADSRGYLYPMQMLCPRLYTYADIPAYSFSYARNAVFAAALIGSVMIVRVLETL